MKYYMGMDIGGTKCAVVISEKNSNAVKDKIRFETKTERGWQKVVGELISSAFEITQRNGIALTDVISCGVSCGGPLDSDSGIIMRPPNLPDWDNVPLCDIFKERYGVPVFLQNDANACAVAEWKFGAGQGYNNMVFLTFGTGMGAGLILDGRLYSGTNDMAGEVGHIRVAEDGPVGYGKKGSFEGFCSGGGIERLAKEMYKKNTANTMLDESDFSAKAVAEAAKSGDAFALSVYDKCAEMLGRGLSVIIDIINPQAVVIGSIYERSGELLKDRMMQIINDEALPLSASVCKILPAKLSDSIGDYAAIGVAAAGLENVNG